MPDINLLPEDLKNKKGFFSKKEKKDFNLEEVEFTGGRKLKKDFEDDNLNLSDKFLKWVEPKLNEDSGSFKKINLQDFEKVSKITKDIPEKKDNDIKVVIDKNNNLEDKNKQNNGFFSNLFKDKNKQNKEILPNEILKKEDVKVENKPLEKDNFKSADSLMTDLANKVSIENLENPIKDKDKKNINFSANKEKIKIVEKVEKDSVNYKVKKKNFTFKNIFKIFKSKDKQDSYEDADVNLLPAGINIPSRKNLFFILISTFVLSIMLIVVAYFGLNIYEMKIASEYEKVDAEITEHLNSISSYEDLIIEIKDWQNRLNKIKAIFSKHIYWTKFFEMIEDNTLADIQFASFAGNIDGSLTLSASAPDYQTLVKQWNYWNEASDFVDEVIIEGASLSSDGLSSQVLFSVVMNFVDDIFYKPIGVIDTPEVK